MSETRKLRGNSPTRKLACLWLNAVLLALSIFGASSTVLAQERAEEKTTKLERHLGVKRGELIARDGASDLPVSPVAEDNVAGAAQSFFNSASLPNIHGETSVENFRGTQNNLSHTHESASGFREFLGQWYWANFHYRDLDVMNELFHDAGGAYRNYDLWPRNGVDTGIDAVRVAFHSSHGVTSNNVFFTSMGAKNYYGEMDARSDWMALGGNWNSYSDERLRYMFWDACNSVMRSGGNNPWSTWATRSRGIRFVFGYETTSIDSPNYGWYFWEEWSKGKTFRNAFFDASWRISRSQSPALVAFGANYSEASYRRDNERYLYPEAVANNWAAWSWCDSHVIYSNLNASPGEALADGSRVSKIEVTGRGNSNEEVTEIANAFGIQLPDESAIKSRPADIKMVRTDALTLVVEKNGNFELMLNTPEQESDTDAGLSDELLIARAEQMADQLSFIEGQYLRVGVVRDLYENAGTGGSEGEERVMEKTIVFDQTINGTPFIDPEAGHLEITFGARTGQVKRIRNTLKAVRVATSDDEVASARIMALDEARQAALAAFRRAAGDRDEITSSAEMTQDSEAVGYQMIDGKATLVYRAHIKSSAVPGMRPFQAIIPLAR